MTTIAPFRFKHIVFGQFLSLLIALSGVLSKFLERHQASFPAFQSFLMYTTVAIGFTSYRVYLNQVKTTSLTLRVDWKVYLILSIIDVQANVLVIGAYRYANFATVALLLHLTIPFVTAMSYYVLSTRYLWKHYIGSSLALVGSFVIFINDFRCASENEFVSDEAKGNLMCVISAFLYSVSNVTQEWCVSQGKSNASIEFLSMTGILGTIFACVQFSLLERTHLMQLAWTPSIACAFAAEALVLVVFYALVSVFLCVAESLLFNLSLLTSDIFCVAASFLVFQEPVSPYYWGALVFNVIGITIYSIEKPQDNSNNPLVDTDSIVSLRFSMVSIPNDTIASV